MCRFFYVSNVASRCCFAFGTFVFFLRVNPLSLFGAFAGDDDDDDDEKFLSSRFRADDSA